MSEIAAPAIISVESKGRVVTTAMPAATPPIDSAVA
jgi:hypothetical protein